MKYYNDPIWPKDPKMTPFREQPKYGVDLGWPGSPNQKASLAYAKYIVVDTFARAVQDGDSKAAVEWGAPSSSSGRTVSRSGPSVRGCEGGANRHHAI